VISEQQFLCREIMLARFGFERVGGDGECKGAHIDKANPGGWLGGFLGKSRQRRFAKTRKLLFRRRCRIVFVRLSLIRLNDNRAARLQLYPSGYIATGVAC
jgi:hypothetical protein